MRKHDIFLSAIGQSSIFRSALCHFTEVELICWILHVFFLQPYFHSDLAFLYQDHHSFRLPSVSLTINSKDITYIWMFLNVTLSFFFLSSVTWTFSLWLFFLSLFIYLFVCSFPYSYLWKSALDRDLKLSRLVSFFFFFYLVWITVSCWAFLVFTLIFVSKFLSLVWSILQLAPCFYFFTFSAILVVQSISIDLGKSVLLIHFDPLLVYIFILLAFDFTQLSVIFLTVLTPLSFQFYISS